MRKALPYFTVLYFIVGSLSFLDGLHPMAYAIQSQLQLFTLACIAYAGASKILLGLFVIYTGYIVSTDWLLSEVSFYQFIIEVVIFFCLYAGLSSFKNISKGL